MFTALERLLRLRALQEDVCRMELEAEAARLSAIERGAEQAAGEVRASRERWFALVEEQGEVPSPLTGNPALGEDWRGPGGTEASSARRMEEEAERQAVQWRAFAEAERPGQEVRVERAATAYRTQRRERIQVETLRDAEAEVERTERNRGEQRAVDDWFGSRPKPEGESSQGPETEGP